VSRERLQSLTRHDQQLMILAFLRANSRSPPSDYRQLFKGLVGYFNVRGSIYQVRSLHDLSQIARIALDLRALTHSRRLPPFQYNSQQQAREFKELFQAFGGVVSYVSPSQVLRT